MTEIKYSIERARDWRHRLDLFGGPDMGSIQWYLSMGLWETLGWSNDDARYHIFRWYITGKDEP